MSTNAEYFSLPSRASGLQPISGTTAWAYGAWVEIDRIDSGLFVSGIQFQLGVLPTIANLTMEHLFEIGVGAAGAEVTKIQVPYTSRLTSIVGYYKTSAYTIFFAEPMLVVAGTRLAVRAVDSIAASAYYEGVKLICRDVVDPVVTLNSPSDLTVITDRTPSTTLTGTSVDGFNLEYKIQISKSNSFSTDLLSLSQSTGPVWYGVAVDSSNQNVYVTAYGLDIYKQTGGVGSFVALGQTARNWTGITIDSSNHNVYATVNGLDIYKQTGGVGSFIALSQAAAAGDTLAVDISNQNVYSTVNGVDIYKQTAGTGSFVALGAGALIWAGIAIDPSTHDVYVAVNKGDIYKQTGGVGSFIALNQVNRAWIGLSIDTSNRNLYAIANVNDMYVMFGCSGNFVAQGQVYRGWSSISVDSTTHSVYAVHYGIDIYKQANPTMLLDKVSIGDAGFADISNGANTHPFPTGEQVQHTVQPADILGPGMYYWRVSVRDPLGTNFYRSWTVPRSFTLLTGPKTWNGSIWDYKPIKIWNGMSWDMKPMKVWNGTLWEVKG